MGVLQQYKPKRRVVSTRGTSRFGCKTNANYKKVLLCIWWDCRGIINKEYLKSGQDINSTIYSNMLIKVSDAIREKRKKRVKKKRVLFHQDNACLHVSAMTSWTLYTLEWDLMQHPPYSPDIAPPDYYMFSHLQLRLDGTISHLNDEVKNEVDHFPGSRLSQFFAEGVEKLPKRWQTIVDLNGDYYPH